MIIEQHYDDEVLIGLLNEAEEDKHVPVCGTCTGTLESYRDLSAALHDDTVWDERELPETPAPQTTNFLRSFADRTRAEDAAAASIVPKLIANPSLIDEHPEWRTAGVVRGLLKVVDAKNFSEPKLAADVAALAVKVADSLEPGRYPFDAVTKLRGQAWRAHAHMLYYTGSYTESLRALDRSDDVLMECVVAEYDVARAHLLRAQIYSEIEKFNESLSLSEFARQVFRRFGDVRRETVADATKAAALTYARQFSEALPIFLRLSADPRIDDTARAFHLHNAAVCYRELSQLELSKVLFAQAVTEYERLGLAAPRARSRWNLAQVLMAEQRYEQSLALALDVRREFQELGMVQDVALTSLDAAEALLMLDRPTEVVDLCKTAAEYFANAGLAYTQGALTALAYLKESAEARTLTPVGVGQVRTFFQILPKQPHLLFAFSA